MKRQLLIIVLALAIPSLAVAQTTTAPPAKAATASQRKAAAVPYGSNPAAGKTVVHDGVTLYYEVYGQGEPLLIIHGNGGSIGTMAPQIAFFRSRYRVIAMDSRDQGKSGDSPGKITYEKMTDDLAALLDHLKTGPVDVLGWSDGGIEALLLGIRHPAKVKKIAAMAANLNPSTDAVYPETWAMARSMLDAIPAAEKDTPQGRRAIKVTSMMFEEPNIAPSALEAITAPTLVLAERSRSDQQTSTHSTSSITFRTASSASSRTPRTWCRTTPPRFSTRRWSVSSGRRSSRRTGSRTSSRPTNR